jgi:hypothetical protein
MYESDHTPTPWSVNGFDPHIITALRSPGAAWGLENRLATLDVGHPDEEGAREMALKNARHIVKCVNAHDGLVAVLKDLLEEAGEILGELNSERLNDGWDAWDDSDTPAIVKARALLAEITQGISA